MEKRDLLAEKIRQRREGKTPTPPPHNQDALTAGTIGERQRVLAELRQQAEAVSKNPVAFAKLMQPLLENGFTKDQLAKALNINRSWLVKRLEVLKASADQRAQLENGSLTVTGFYEARRMQRDELERGARAAKQKAKRRGGTAYRRQRRFIFDEETTKAIGHVLNHNALSLGLARMDVETTKRRDLQRAITLRVHEIWDIIKSKA
jgi:hypothetical protein